MVYRTVSLCLAVVALTLFAGAAVPANEKKADGDKTAQRGDTHEGTVVRVTADKLVMRGKARDGEEAAEHTHKLAANARVTCDGKACKLEDLKRGQKIRVTTDKGDQTVATRVEALARNERFDANVGKEPERKDNDRNRR